MSSKPQDISQLIAKVNKAAGKKVIDLAGNVKNVYHLRRPSGIMQLDIDTGGGLPSSSMNFLTGPEGGGKTRLLLSYMAQQQRYYGNKCVLAFGAIEHPVDHFHWRQAGVKIAVPMERIEKEQETRKLKGQTLLTKEEIKELQTEVGTVLVFNHGTMEATLDLSLDILATRECQLLCIDSISALMPKDTEEKNLEDNLKMAAHASVLTTFFKKYHSISADLENPIPTTCIFTQQVRANKKKAEAPSYMQKYLPDYAASEAWSSKHGKVFDLLITSGEKVKDKKSGEGSGNVVSKALRWETAKGKAGSHEGIKGEVNFDFSIPGGIDFTGALILTGMTHGIVKEKDGKLTFLKKDGEALIHESLKSISRADVAKLFAKEAQIEYLVRLEILGVAEIDCRYK